MTAAVSHQSDGLDRVEFSLPENTPADCTQFVTMNDGNLVSIATAAWGSATCPHRLGIVPADLMRLDRGLKIPTSRFSFSTNLIDVEYGDYSAANMPDSVTVPFFEAPQSGCTILKIDEDRLLQVRFGGGASLLPGFSTKQPELTAKGELIGPDGTRFVVDSYGGRFSFSAPMGGEIWKPSQWTFRLLSPTSGAATVNARPKVEWKTPPDFAKYSRDRDVILEWVPAQGDTKDRVYFPHTVGSPDQLVNGVYGHHVSCSAPVSAGQLTVPPR